MTVLHLSTSFFLGFAGSVHCAGMCGPLVLALHTAGMPGKMGGFLYNTGRVAMYCVLGAITGLIGSSFKFAGLQSWLSIIAGLAMLCGLAATSRRFGFANASIFKAVTWLKSNFSRLLRHRSKTSVMLLGALNGLLPCGLVYAACAAALAAGDFPSAIAFMLAFGIGTLPLMMGLSFAGRRLQVAAAQKLQRLVPLSLLVMSLFLVARGVVMANSHNTSSAGNPTCPACQNRP